MSTPAPTRTRLTRKLTVVLGLLGISVFINYVDRGNLSIAAPMLKDELGISATQLGMLLSGFFWTYALLVPLAGWLVDRFNANWVLAAGFFIWSCATSAAGFAHSLSVLFLLRLAVGMGESVAFPGYSKIIALHFSEEHRGLANAIIMAGLALGPGLGMLIGGMLMARFGWRPFFIVLGGASLLWLIPWIKWMPKAPDPERLSTTAGAPNLGEFLRLKSAWGTCMGLFCANYMNYFFITWLPFYLVRERHFSMDKMAKVGDTAYLLAAGFAALTGLLSDRWIVAGGTPTRVRKTIVGGGIALAGIFTGLTVVGGPRFCIVMVTLGVIFFAVSGSNLWSITQTLAGADAAGRWTGFQNFVGSLAGIVAPAVTGLVLQRTGSFQWAFALVAAFAFAGASSWFLVVGPVEPVVWHRRDLLPAALVAKLTPNPPAQR